MSEAYHSYHKIIKAKHNSKCNYANMQQQSIKANPCDEHQIALHHHPSPSLSQLEHYTCQDWRWQTIIIIFRNSNILGDASRSVAFFLSFRENLSHLLQVVKSLVALLKRLQPSSVSCTLDSFLVQYLQLFIALLLAFQILSVLIFFCCRSILTLMS